MSLFTQSIIMGLCAVAFMYLKAVAGVLFGQLQHHVITGNFCQNRRRSDAGAETIPMNNGLMGDLKLSGPVAVDQQKVRLYRLLTALSIARKVAWRILISSISFSSAKAMP